MTTAARQALSTSETNRPVLPGLGVMSDAFKAGYDTVSMLVGRYSMHQMREASRSLSKTQLQSYRRIRPVGMIASTRSSG